MLGRGFMSAALLMVTDVNTQHGGVQGPPACISGWPSLSWLGLGLSSCSPILLGLCLYLQHENSSFCLSSASHPVFRGWGGIVWVIFPGLSLSSLPRLTPPHLNS